MKFLSDVFRKFAHRNDDAKACKAAFNGDFDAALALIDGGANVNATHWIDGQAGKEGGEGNIGYAAITAGNLKALEAALDRGLSANLQSPYRQPLLCFAIQNGEEEAAKMLVKRGADCTDQLFADYLSPLALAKIYKMESLLELMKETLSPEKLAEAEVSVLPWHSDITTSKAIVPLKPPKFSQRG